MLIFITSFTGGLDRAEDVARKRAHCPVLHPMQPSGSPARRLQAVRVRWHHEAVAQQHNRLLKKRKLKHGLYVRSLLYASLTRLFITQSYTCAWALVLTKTKTKTKMMHTIKIDGFRKVSLLSLILLIRQLKFQRKRGKKYSHTIIQISLSFSLKERMQPINERKTSRGERRRIIKKCK